MTSFATRSEEALRRFLRTAVVVDDNVSSSSKENVSVLNIPMRGVNTGTSTDIPQSQSQSGGINGTALVEAFLKENILCTVLERRSGPEEGENIPVADIFVLDWMFGDEGGKAILCIRKCTVEHPHAVHLICIYTSEPDVSKISSKLINDFPGITEVKNGNIFKINNTYIVILKKKIYGNTSENMESFKEVSEDDLPKELIKIFSVLTGGLLPNAVLHALSAIRDNTYALLSRFPSSLDPAFLSHRVYSNPCEDTEQHIIPLICSEISSILAQEKISDDLNVDAITAWIDAESTPCQNPKALCIEEGKNIDNYISDFLINGVEKIKNIPEDIKNRILNVRDSAMTEYWGSDDPIRADIELAMLMSYEYMYSNTRPILKSGSILKSKSDIYYICIQPPCDCTRIEKRGKPFIFSPMTEMKNIKNDNYNFVFFDDNGSAKYLYCGNKSHKIVYFCFVPEKANDNIYAYEDNGKWYFKSKENGDFLLVMQLKEIHALRVIHDHAVNLSRIGLMESDWLRRCNLK